MSETPSTAAIDLFADLVCPWCYIGWEALKQAAQATPEVRCSVSWRNFMLNPELPAEGVSRQDHYAHLRASNPERMDAARAALISAAEALQAPLNLDAAKVLPNTLDAHRVVHWAADHGLAEAMVDALFRAYFVDGEDIGAAPVLAALAGQVGLDEGRVALLLAEDTDRAAVTDFHAAAVRQGVQGVPIVIINRQAVLMGAETPARYAEAIRAAAV